SLAPTAQTPSPVARACDQRVPVRPFGVGTPAHKGGAYSPIVVSLTSWTPNLKQMGVHETGSTSPHRGSACAHQIAYGFVPQIWHPDRRQLSRAVKWGQRDGAIFDGLPVLPQGEILSWMLQGEIGQP